MEKVSHAKWINRVDPFENPSPHPASRHLQLILAQTHCLQARLVVLKHGCS
jgi:hypothetical protein